MRSERINLVQLGRFHLRADEFLCELQHRALLAMDQEGDPRRGFPLPFEKFRLVGVARKPVDGVNARPHRDVFVKNAHSWTDGFAEGSMRPPPRRIAGSS